MANDWRPATDPPAASIATALAKASGNDWWRLVSWQCDQQLWYVPSRSTPGEFYTVRKRRSRVSKGQWWVVLSCTCPAETTGRYVVCWHKAAVYLAWKRRHAWPSYQRTNGSARVLLPGPTPLVNDSTHTPEWPLLQTPASTTPHEPNEVPDIDHETEIEIEIEELHLLAYSRP